MVELASYGMDIAANRLDDLDKAALRFALDYRGRKIAVDLGCGEGRVAKLLALMGYEVWAYDIRDMSEHFALWEHIHFTQCDIRNICNPHTETALPSGVVIAVAQRILHHIPYNNALYIVRHLRGAMSDEGRLYLALSGLHSKLADGYTDAHKPVDERYGEVGELGKDVYAITDKVCLYDTHDAQKLLHEAGFTIDKHWESAFGNIKTISHRGEVASPLEG